MDPLLHELVEHLVYADTLQTKGDPRGELIALQCRGVDSDESRAREHAAFVAACYALVTGRSGR